MNEMIEQGTEENYFSQEPVHSFDPRVISSRRRTSNTFPLTSKIPKGVKELVKMYMRKTQHALSSEEASDDESFAS
jgi:hypothetical protein